MWRQEDLARVQKSRNAMIYRDISLGCRSPRNAMICGQGGSR
jgi:hypothetical protein